MAGAEERSKGVHLQAHPFVTACYCPGHRFAALCGRRAPPQGVESHSVRSLAEHMLACCLLPAGLPLPRQRPSFPSFRQDARQGNLPHMQKLAVPRRGDGSVEVQPGTGCLGGGPN